MNVSKLTFNQRHVFVNELINSITHGIGAVMSVVGLVILVVMASMKEDAWHVVSYSIYGASMVMLYTASTLYHSFSKEKIKKILQKIDHSAIYFLIAGTYTPFTLITLKGTTGWVLFGAVWAMALGGVIFKLFYYTKKMRVISALIYVAMGWCVVFAFKPLIDTLPFWGFFWLMAGGFFYTGGVVFYIWTKLPFNHGIWHLFVLGGSICHFITILLYV